MAKNTFYSVKQTQGEQDPPNFDSVFTERYLLPREVTQMCEIRHFRKTGMGRLRHLRRLRRFSPILLSHKYFRHFPLTRNVNFQAADSLGITLILVGIYDLAGLEIVALCRLQVYSGVGVAVAFKVAQVGAAVDQFVAVQGRGKRMVALLSRAFRTAGIVLE